MRPIMHRRTLGVLAFSALALFAALDWDATASERAGGGEVWQAGLVQRLDEPWRSWALRVARAPQLCLTGRAEVFPCRREFYLWLLDHPDWGYRLWEQLGARGARVQATGSGGFTGEDEQGNHLRWWAVHREPGLRLWYAEASGRGKWLAQPAQVRALVLLEYRGVRSPEGQPGIRHQAELAAQVDSRGWNLILRLGQHAAEDFARQCLDQVQLFFAGMAWYMTEHPDWTQQQIRKLVRERPDHGRPGEELLRLLVAAHPTESP
ncbi:hypothetical protein HRbin36_01426 [bacterium HR36]|nr:hypothetical protein HRbin36_01426 [bacterium HR36]